MLCRFVVSVVDWWVVGFRLSFGVVCLVILGCSGCLVFGGLWFGVGYVVCLFGLMLVCGISGVLLLGWCGWMVVNSYLRVFRFVDFVIGWYNWWFGV